MTTSLLPRRAWSDWRADLTVVGGANAAGLAEAITMGTFDLATSMRRPAHRVV
jgi:hypothetical protein